MTLRTIPSGDPWENESPNQMNAATPERRLATGEISGLIGRVTFHNDDSGFCVLRVKERSQREETAVVGSLPSVTAGEWLVAEAVERLRSIPKSCYYASPTQSTLVSCSLSCA